MACCQKISFPHGNISILALVLSFATVLLVNWGVGGCRMVRLKQSDTSLYFGPILHEYDQIGGSYRDCVRWDQDQRDTLFDAYMNTAWAFAILSYVAAVPAFLSLLAMSCCSAKKGWLIALACILGFSALFQALTFLIFASDFVQDRKEVGIDLMYGGGSGIATAGFATALVTAFVVARIPTVEDSTAPQPSAQVTPVSPADDEEAASEPKMAVTE